MSTGNELVTLKQVDNYYKDLRKRSAPVIFNSATGNPAVFSDGADGLPIQSLKVHLLPRQEGTGDPSPENIRSFIPWNGIDIFSGGKNLVGCTIGETKSVNGIDYTVLPDGSVNCEGTANSSSYGIESKRLTLPGGMYTFSVTGATNAHVVIVKNNTYYREINGVGSTTFALTEETVIHFYIMFSSGSVANETVYVQLEVGQTATAYEPYHTITETDISFQSPIYGGTLDVVSGVMKVEYGIYTFTGNEQFDRSTNQAVDFYFFRWAYDWQGFDLNWNVGEQNTYVENYPVANNLDYWYSGGIPGDKRAWTVSSYQGITFRNDEYESTSEFAQSLTGTKMVYKLATPVEIQLTPAQLQSLLGNNTIWSDANGDIEVEYRADTNKFISDAIANQPHATSGGYGIMTPGAGLSVLNDKIITVPAGTQSIKAGTSSNLIISPAFVGDAAFYGLARAAGVDMAQSSNPVGQFTDEAKIAIKEMLGIYDAPFRLINEITVPEDCLYVNIGTDSYGLPFDLHEIVVKIITKQTNGTGNGSIVINSISASSDSPYLSLYNSFKDSGDHIVYAHAWIAGKRFFGEAPQGSMSQAYTPAILTRNPNASGIFEVESITSITYKSLNGCTLKAGSIITLYGR